MKLYRQGDVLFKAIKSIPAGGVKRENGVVAYGEVTGHSHQLQLEDRVESEVLEIENRLYVRVKGSATFVHEEHAPTVLPAGAYEVVIQREYQPEGIRSVQD